MTMTTPKVQSEDLGSFVEQDIEGRTMPFG
jgi:hypothetical protein